ncbi:hypothetical protein DIPPA_24158, partial [Diplonema papillatum]
MSYWGDGEQRGYRIGDTVEVLRGSGSWQPAIVVTSTPREVLVQWGGWKKVIQLPSKFVRPSVTPLPSREEDGRHHSAAGHPAQQQRLQRPKPPENRCGSCRASDVTLWPCTGCYAAAYCGEDCQQKAWPQHRFVCEQKHTAPAPEPRSASPAASPRTGYPASPEQERREASMLQEVYHHRYSPATALRYAAAEDTTADLLDEFPHLVPDAAVEACQYTDDRAHFNGLHGIVVGYRDNAKVLVQFFLRNGVILAISPYHLRPALLPSPAFPLGCTIAAGTVAGRQGSVVGYRGSLLLVEFDGTHKGVFP